VAAIEAPDWFSGFLPDELLLGDPGMRDALMHGNQVCVPDGTLLPAGIERVYPGGAKLAGTGEVRFCATERERTGDTYIYDIAVRNAAGEVVERWDGLKLQAVRKKDGRGPWVAPLLASYLERSFGDLVGGTVAVAVEPDTDGSDRREQTAIAAGRALGRPVTVRYRPDGRPEIDGDAGISAAHGAGITLCVAGPGTLGCDVEPVAERSEQEWAGLLGQHVTLCGVVASELGEDQNTSATRVWAAIECLQKAGITPASAPLTMTPARRDGWSVFASGSLRIATLVTTLREVEGLVVFAILND
jgi:enediyne polyketide synthase